MNEGSFAASPQGRPMGGVDDRLSQIARVSDLLQEQVKTLVERLAPVTKSMITKEATCEKPVNPMPVESPIAVSIRSVILQLQDTSGAISDVLNRLDI